MNHRTLLISLAGLTFVTPVFSGTVFEFETKEFDGLEPILSTVQMSTSGANTRLEIISVTSDEAGGLIYLGDSREMIILDHLQGQYVTMDQDQMTAMSGEVSSAVTQMQSEMSPEQRAEAEKVRQERLAAQRLAEASAEINDLGSRGEVAGVPCHVYEVLRNGRKVRELCVSQWQDLEGGHETAAAIQRVVEFFESMRQVFSGTDNMQVFDRQRELFGHIGELDGYPVLYRDFAASGKMTRETRLTAARQRDIGPDFFSPPESYTPLEMTEDPE